SSPGCRSSPSDCPSASRSIAGRTRTPSLRPSSAPWPRCTSATPSRPKPSPATRAFVARSCHPSGCASAGGPLLQSPPSAFRSAAEAAARLSSLLELIAERLAAHPLSPVGDISLLDEASSERVAAVNLESRGDTASFTLPALFAAQVARTPERAAVRGEHDAL